LPSTKWDIKMKSFWNIGEVGANNRLTEFLNNGVKNYKKGRNIPSKPFVSRLSPHLHFGEISPNQAWYAAQKKGDDNNIDHFCSELGWREFSYTQLYFNPELPKKNLQSKFDLFPWDEDEKKLIAWQKGQTGIPMVDAGMRELWITGAMHNRVRMVVGSFLVKNLLLHWHHGERWFWDCLVDADLASNSASWQWIAGCGADAAPYFRIFNPVTQGQKFDPDGEYIRKYIPEISDLPNKYLFNPWEAPQEELDRAGVVIGKDYPKPIIDLKLSRQNALEAFKSLKKVDD
jgi:deoxyribodipyrimidine photo-lyase